MHYELSSCTANSPAPRWVLRLEVGQQFEEQSVGSRLPHLLKLVARLVHAEHHRSFTLHAISHRKSFPTQFVFQHPGA